MAVQVRTKVAHVGSDPRVDSPYKDSNVFCFCPSLMSVAVAWWTEGGVEVENNVAQAL